MRLAILGVLVLAGVYADPIDLTPAELKPEPRRHLLEVSRVSCATWVNSGGCWTVGKGVRPTVGYTAHRTGEAIRANCQEGPLGCHPNSGYTRLTLHQVPYTQSRTRWKTARLWVGGAWSLWPRWRCWGLFCFILRMVNCTQTKYSGCMDVPIISAT